MCLAQQPGDSSCSGHLAFPVTTPVPSPPKHTGKHCHPWDLPDGLLYVLQPGPAVGEEVEHGLQPCAEGWPLSSTYQAKSPACPCASSSCLASLFRPGNISSRVPCPTAQHCCLLSGAHKPSLEKKPVLLGNSPWAQTLPSLPLTSGVPVGVSPAHARCTASAHMPFAWQLLKSNLDLNDLPLQAP